MKKHINEVIRQAGEHSETKITEMVMTHFRDLGFELVKRKDLKKQEKTIKNLHSQINELVHDNWQIQMKLYESGLGTIGLENTNVEASKFGEETLISTQAVTEGARQGGEANDVELDADASITAIMNSLDSHIDKMTKTLDDANYTRIKFELDEMEAILDEPDAGMEDPALDEAVDLYMYYIEIGHVPYQARLMALLHVKEKIEDSGYEAYWIDVYNYLKLLKFTM